MVERIHSHAELEGMENIVTVWRILKPLRCKKYRKTLDRAVIINVLFQVEEVATIFREAARLLRKGGKLLVVDWQDKDSPDWSITRGTFGETRVCFCRTAVGLIFERDFERTISLWLDFHKELIP